MRQEEAKNVRLHGVGEEIWPGSLVSSPLWTGPHWASGFSILCPFCSAAANISRWEEQTCCKGAVSTTGLSAGSGYRIRTSQDPVRSSGSCGPQRQSRGEPRSAYIRNPSEPCGHTTCCSDGSGRGGVPAACLLGEGLHGNTLGLPVGG